MIRKVLILAAGAIGLTACAVATRLDSGSSYLEGYRPAPPSNRTVAGAAADDTRVAIDADIYAAAAVDPVLRFPARLGLARIHRGQLTLVPQDEVDIWVELTERLGHDFGEFVPISPFVAEVVRGELSPNPRCERYGDRNCQVVETVKDVRLAAARQRVDAVLLYEVFGKASDESTALGIMDLTIVGAFLVPSRALKAGAAANAILLDVRTGFVYGTAQGVADKRSISTNVGSTDRAVNLRIRTETAAVAALTTNVETLARTLYDEIAALE